jgi:type IV pilus secretin PilQ/predicted competence protein
MTVTRAFALCATVAAAGALLQASDRAAGPNTTTPSVRLKTISAKVNGKGASLRIEASEPVAYVASRPDPLTLVLDFRNVGAEGVANSVVANAKSPIASVAVEPVDSLGTPVSRVRIALAQPATHRVRSDRNTVVIDFERTSAKGAPYVMPPASTGSGAPDAMQALREKAEPPALDPIAALGLTPSPALVTLPASAVQGTVSLALPASVAQATPSTLSGLSASAARATPSPAQSAVSPATSPSAAQPATTIRQTQAAAQPEIGTPRGGQRKFEGHPVSLDFQGADLRAVLRTFAEISGLNIVIDPAVQGTVDVALRDVPWDQALDIILAANKLGYLIDGTIVRIAPLTVLAEEQTQRRKVTEEQALAGELRVLTHRLSYAKAEELQGLLTKSALSQRGTVQIDPRTNTLIITDLADRLATASDLIAKLDLAQPQVEIEARIVQTNKNYARALGVQWGFGGAVSPALGNTTNLAFPNAGSLSGSAGGTTGGQPTAVNLGVSAAPNAVALALGSINGAFNLDVALSALENSGNGRLLSTPRVTTQNNVSAEMTQGVQIPIQTVANNTVTVTFRDAALTLRVTPQITAANTVIMQIAVENSVADFSRAVNGIPPINTQRANTSVLVSDGATTVIGGVYVTNQQNQTDRTPGISRIPLLGWMFRRDSVNDQSTELLIFITPRIIKS